MKHLTFSGIILIASITFLNSGCATILSGSNWPVSVKTNPEGAKVVIKNRKGIEIYNATTPAVVKLKSGSGYFGKESYAITFSMDGYEPRTVNLECKINGWYFGNILIGGALGMLVIDPLTGAMYRLDSKDVYENLNSKSGASATGAPSLMIVEKNKVPENLEKSLIKLDTVK